MAMSNNLTTNILINAKTGSGFYQVGATLTELGSIINGLSSQLISFGEDSIEVYRDYEKSMRDAEVALSTNYGRGTRELQTVMTQLDEAATEWAATTIFHTNDVANAISEAAHAGWDYDEIMTGIPAAMELAQAGGLHLSGAVNYIVKSTNAAGIGFEDMGDFIDLWTFAANSSASTIGEFGDAMLRMGSTMRFAANPEELMTLIAVTADAGAVGSEAGTMIRNSIMRLIAPTQKAQDAMELLGATSDEVAEIMDDEALAAASAELASRGFTVFDQKTGEMRPVLDIYSDLSDCLADIAGGYDNIGSNEDALSILSAIFPTRTITEALNLLNATRDGYGGLYDEMSEGAAEGYGSYAAETMMDTLNGNIEIFESKIERLKQVVGGGLSEQLSGVLGTIGGWVDSVAELPEDKLSAIITGAEVLAGTGPALLAAGGAFRLFSLVTPETAAFASVVAMTTMFLAAESMINAAFADNFGDLALGEAEIDAYLNGLGADFRSVLADIDGYAQALDNAVSSYQTASGELKGEMLTASITDTELTPEQIEHMNSLGADMLSAIKDGIDNNYAGLMQGITNAFGIDGGEGEDIDNPIWAQIIDVLAQGYESDIAQAEALGQQLRDAMTAAFEDGHLTADEVSNIQSIIDEQNALLAQQQDRANYLERQRLLRQAQTLGLEGIQEASRMAEEARNTEWETLMSQQDADLYDTGVWYDRAIENGWMIPNADGTAGEHAATEADKTAALAALAAKQEEQRYEYGADYNSFLANLWTEGITGSDLAGSWSALQTLASSFREAGGIVTQAAANGFSTGAARQEATDTSRYLNLMVDALGGYETLAGYAEYFAELGDLDTAAFYQNMMDMYDVLGGGRTTNPEVGVWGQGDYSEQQGTYEQMAAILRGGGSGGYYYTPEELIDILNQFPNEWGEAAPDWHGILGESMYNTMNEAAAAAGYETISDWVSAVEATSPEVAIEPVVNEDAMAESEVVPMPIQPYVEGTDALSGLEDQGVEVSVGADSEELTAVIDGADAQTLIEYLDGDATDLQAVITTCDGESLTEYVRGDTTQLAAAISAYAGRTITVNIRGNQLFAEGGRATTASIFAEAGPEWAIPEEHSERTAALLNAARAASGFTWPDLLARFGGLNANADNTPTTIVYSPVIHAQDARGVDEALRADKARLEKWWREKQMRDAVEVYT